ncbi:hypothetical protein ACXU4B_14740 [Dyella soli]|uniref:Uncharacterized protein n=1 Tax=Dyella soli TaxID=522319 RepID=A0A4R0YNG3_9GAMM|nr:hypothetical protein [Dyella soli]TCI09097.1 hypothetical protein EZM97_22935 [Dyella soli]
MALSIGKILMAYRPLYLRGLLMDGQYKLPAQPTPPVAAKPAQASTEVVAERMPAAAHKPLQGAAT